MEDTICGIATTLGQSAINIIRISGEYAIEIADKIFSRDLKKVKSHEVVYGNIIDNNEIIDEVLLLLFKKPRTYTKEDIVEIQCHGGSFVTKKILELILKNGARLAEPGEFTKRAFINGRIDLSQAEAVMDLISAKTEQGLKYANKALNGEVYSLVSGLKEELIEIISTIEVNIDYPEYDDIIEMTSEILIPKIKSLLSKMELIYEKSQTGRFIREGIDVAIIGKPNVGKSSLLNKLIDEELAIVTDIPGTTRDKILGSLNINGILVNLIDTAGIHKTDDIVEKIGVDKAIESVNMADIVILMLDNSKKLDKEDEELINLIQNKNHIIVLNKCDLENKNSYNGINISIKENKGIDELKNLIYEKAGMNDFHNEMDFLTNIRQIDLLKKAIESLKDCLNSLNLNIGIDVAEIDLKQCWNRLALILGEVSTDDLINEIFKRFCLGK